MKNVDLHKTAILTIVSNNYLHFARTMLQSAKQHHEGAKMYCVIVDTDLSYAKALSSEFEAIPLEKLKLPLGDEFLFQYSILELNTAVKPWAIEYVLERGHDKVIYVDPDIYFYGPMTEVELMLSAGTDILLTPHLLAPVADDKTPSELDIRRAGTYNFGFCAVKDSANTRDFLMWWQRKLTRDCVVDLDKGFFVDQGWIDLVPGLFENVGILRHSGYNVAYWNLAQRPLHQSAEGRYFAGNAPLVFFHFSGLDPFKPNAFSKHQNRFTLSTLGPARAVVENYTATVLKNAAETYDSLKYGFGYFANNENIPDAFRKLYRSSENIRKETGPLPFNNPSAMNAPYTNISFGGMSPSNAMVSIWKERIDLQMTFPLTDADSIKEYYRWFALDPLIEQHFPNSVLSHHKEMIKHFDKLSEGNSKIGTKSPDKTRVRNVKRVQRLYACILGRAPDMEGLRLYSELCRKPFGFIRAWKAIGMSQESKVKPNVAIRMFKALMLAIRI